MDWKSKYKNRICSAEEAVSIIQSDSKVMIGHACGEPSILVEALVARAHSFRNVELFHMVCMGKAEYCKPEFKDVFKFNGIFLGKGTREATDAGRGDIMPCFFFECPRNLIENVQPDVALIHVSLPDENGECSYGVSADYTETAARIPKCKIIFQVNERMPYVYGTTINLERAEKIVCVDDPIIELPRPPISEIEEMIGKNIASLIEDGSTIQLGIGAIPDAVSLFLKDRKDLGVHTELLTESTVDLVEAGAYTNALKTLHPGKFVANFAMGSKRLYDFIDKNPDVLFKPCDYTNDPFIIAQNNKMIAINSSVQIDLMGQANSESIGTTQFSGTGGQVDFIRGARKSPGGKAILALPSSAKKGTISKIVARLDPGSTVTTSRNDVDYVVTEYGIAKLWGLNLRQRAKALIEIAHPNFREQLEKDAWECRNLR